MSKDAAVQDEQGFVLVWFALLIGTLLGAAGFAVDVGYWYTVGNKAQKAADASALSAAFYWPGNQPAATSEARLVAASNGFTDGGRVHVTVNPGPRPAQVAVTVVREVDTIFAGVFGVRTKTVTRRAVAEYQGPVPMGSPASTFGDEPLQSGQNQWSNLYGPGLPAGTRPQFWANIFGPRSEKSKGDAHQAKVCTSSSAHHCPEGGVSPPAGANTSNSDYRLEGYQYLVSVANPPAGAAKLAVEVFDPAFVNVGDACTLNLNGAPSSGSPNRYASGSSSPFCTGDQLYTGSGEDGASHKPITTYIFRRPDNTPWNNLDNPVLDDTACDSDRRQFSGYDASIASLLGSNPQETNAYSTAGSRARFADHFRRWFRMCEIPIAQVPAGGGSYVLQVRTNAPLGSPYSSTWDRGGGANRFSIRAAWLQSDGTPVSTGVNIFAADTMSIYANSQGADTRFYLARVLPGADGRTLNLRFFDTGDASQPGNLTVLPPADSTVGASFGGCTHTRQATGAVGAPTAAGCTIQALTSATDNGDWIEVNVPIPDGYTCNLNAADGCWVKVRFTYPAGTTVNDTTTWSARIVGDPIRLVE